MTPNFLMRNLLIASMLTMPLSVKAAGIPVIDSSNLTQAIQQVVADGTKIANQVSQIANQVQQINQLTETLRTVGAGEFSALTASLTNQFTEVQSVLGSLSGISYRLADIQADFRAKFPAAADWATVTAAAYETLKGQWDQQIEDIALEAMKSQAVTARIQAYNDSARRMLSQSQAGNGQVRQMQAMNQLMTVLVQQLSDLSQQLASSGRLTAVHLAQQAKEREASRAMTQRLMTGFASSGPPVTVTTSWPTLSY